MRCGSVCDVPSGKTPIHSPRASAKSFSGSDQDELTLKSPLEQLLIILRFPVDRYRNQPARESSIPAHQCFQHYTKAHLPQDSQRGNLLPCETQRLDLTELPGSPNNATCVRAVSYCSRWPATETQPCTSDMIAHIQCHIRVRASTKLSSAHIGCFIFENDLQDNWPLLWYILFSVNLYIPEERVCC